MSDPADEQPHSSEADFSSLYRRTYWKLYAFTRRRLDDEDSARDIVAETYRVAWQKRESAIPIGLPYLYAVCRNLLGNEYQRRTREESLLNRLASTAVRFGNPASAGLLHVLDSLPADQREVIYLTYWEDLPAQDVAKVLGCTDQTVWKRLSRGRAELKRRLSVGAHRSH